MHVRKKNRFPNWKKWNEEMLSPTKFAFKNSSKIDVCARQYAGPVSLPAKQQYFTIYKLYGVCSNRFVIWRIEICAVRMLCVWTDSKCSIHTNIGPFVRPMSCVWKCTLWPFKDWCSFMWRTNVLFFNSLMFNCITSLTLLMSFCSNWIGRTVWDWVIFIITINWRKKKIKSNKIQRTCNKLV